MKNLEEKKLLVKMMRMFGQEVDPKLLESIEKEENLNETLFGEKPKPATPILKPVSQRVEVVAELVEPETLPIQPEKSAETGIVPPEEVRVKQVADYISAISKLPPESSNDNKELEGVKKALADLLKKVNTLSWGGGGTGIVNIGQADDFDKSSYGEGYTMRWINGMFRLDPHGGGGGSGGAWFLMTHNYTAVDNDKIIGDTSAGSFTITLPAHPITGDEVTIMDGSDWSINPITIARNGNTIEGIADDMYSDNKGALITLVYNGNVGSETWQVAATSLVSRQVQPDWNQADTTSVDYIKNKPSIPAAQVNSDWNSTSGLSQILNKPSIPAAQIQSDWNQTTTTALDYIKNKPLIWMDTNNHIVVGATMVPSDSITLGTPDQPFSDAYFGAHSVSIMPDAPTGNIIILENVDNILGVTSGGFGVKDPTQTFYNFLVDTGGYTHVRTANPLLGQAALEISANPSANIIPLVSTAMGGAIHTTGAVYGPTLNTMDNFDNVNPYNSGNAIVFRRFRGSVDAPTAVQNTDRLGSVAAAGYGGSTPYSPTGLPPGAQNSMIFRATENHTVSNQGGHIEFWAVPDTTNVAVQVVTVNPSGSNTGIVLNQSGSGITYGDGTFQNAASFPLTTKDEGTTLTTTTKTINFVGGGITATESANNVTVTVDGISLLTYGSFYSTVNQTAAAINTPYAITFNASNIPDGHSISNNSRVVSSVTGIFHYHYAIEIESSNASLQNFYCWLRKNGTDIPNTTRIVSLSDNHQYALASSDFVVSLNAGEYVELMWATNDLSLRIAAPAATAFCPATPSAIITIQQVK